MNKKRVVFSPGGCKMCEACVSLAPECFEVDDDTGMLIQKEDCVDAGLAQELCAYCPEDCIEMEDIEE